MTGGMAILIMCSTCKHFHPVERQRGWCVVLGTVFNDHKCEEWQASKKSVKDAFRMAKINPRSEVEK